MTLQALRKKYIGDRAFYRMVLAVAVPIMIQSGITNFVSLLDNIMVGRIGTEQIYRRGVRLFDIRVEVGGIDLVKVPDRLKSCRIPGVVFLYDKRCAAVRHNDRLACLRIL